MALNERMERGDEIKIWYGNLPVESLYTAGIAGEKFFRTLKDQGKFLGTRCVQCGIVYVPGRIFCERCFSKLDEWVQVASSGTLESWTELHVDINGEKLDAPVLVGLIKLDGTSTVMVHRLNNVTGEELKFGLQVKAALLPKSKRTGAITDIAYFEPGA
ncbi:MAG: Zn-ribbon domain-containing OB-fold protein [candidate division WOR-3 bacterium]